MKRSSASRREAEERQRRDYILLAAERIFAARPFDEASMQEIAQEAGIGMHGLYRFFPSKQELYEEIILLRVNEILERSRALIAGVGPTERLRLLAVAHSRFFLEHPHFFPLFVTRRLSRDWGLKTKLGKALDRCMAEVDAQVTEAIAAAVKKGELRPLGTELLVAAVKGIFDSVIQFHLLHGKPGDAETCAAEMHDLFVRGCGKR
jgi:TetR/AcrR family transcriptional regulator